ncbi:YhdH/YhfP family quinone oxidoreductase [Fusibacter sp. JL298sf-3]
MEKRFKALWVTEASDGRFEQAIVSRRLEDLPAGDVLIEVAFSSLNYKDALSASGNKGVTRNYPHTPGIDAAGTVVSSTDPRFAAGEAVLVTGYDLGMNTSGGYGGYIRVPADWVVKCPQALSPENAMAYGTAGFTAALSVYKMMAAGVTPSDGTVLVTGATGGVGSIAVALLSHLGYTVAASTGKATEADRLKALGATEIVSRAALDDTSGRAMLKGQWAGVIDTVGGNTLATAVKTTQYGGSVTTCGNVAAPTFTSSVYPFILRGVNLLGVDSVQCPMALRTEIWEKLATTWRVPAVEAAAEKVTLENLPSKIEAMLAGRHAGRTVVVL